mmetsp:Transcript_68103/g.183937  ORF Transcript_68103/g.183937 Transcript_68103/m.183937 type:complete len:216 (+) Transcript_68103:246-893(+)
MLKRSSRGSSSTLIKHWSMNMSSPQKHEPEHSSRKKSRHLCIPSPQAVTAFRESTSIGPCSPYLQLLMYTPSERTLSYCCQPGLAPVASARAPSTMQPCSSLHAKPLQLRYRAHSTPHSWRVFSPMGHSKVSAQLPSPTSLHTSHRRASTADPCASWAAFLKWSCGWCAISTIRSRAGKNTVSGSTFTVQANFRYSPSLLSFSHTAMKIAVFIAT